MLYFWDELAARLSPVPSPPLFLAFTHSNDTTTRPLRGHNKVFGISVHVIMAQSYAIFCVVPLLLDITCHGRSACRARCN